MDELGALLELLRQRPSLRERQRGVFYRGSRAFLHFHEDRTGLHADVRAGADWRRYAVSDRADWPALIAHIDEALG